jgi:hypothetical protein
MGFLLRENVCLDENISSFTNTPQSERAESLKSVTGGEVEEKTGPHPVA